MTANRLQAVLLAAAVLACAGGQPANEPAEESPELVAPGFEAPVLTNSEPPVRYPPALFRQATPGNVILRLHVGVDGRIVPESTRVHESSGYTAFDSAALAAVDSMRFAPARRDGEPVAATFLLPIQFRRPS